MKVLVVAVHPDDETLGCGGTLLKHKYNGDKIFWLIVTSIHEEHGYDREAVEQRKKEINRVGEKYRFDGVFSLNFPTIHLDEIPISDLVTSISNVIVQAKPNLIYLPFKGDIHSDHRIAFRAAYSCTKSFRYPFLKKILMMETLSETEFAPATKEEAFVPNIFVDISDFLEQKLKIMEIYQSESDEHPFPRNTINIQALATFRGATAACKYAESFMLLKEII